MTPPFFNKENTFVFCENEGKLYSTYILSKAITLTHLSNNIPKWRENVALEKPSHLVYFRPLKEQHLVNLAGGPIYPREVLAEFSSIFAHAGEHSHVWKQPCFYFQCIDNAFN